MISFFCGLFVSDLRSSILDNYSFRGSSYYYSFNNCSERSSLPSLKKVVNDLVIHALSLSLSNEYSTDIDSTSNSAHADIKLWSMLSKSQYMLWLSMHFLQFRFRDIYSDQQDDMLKTFLLVNFLKASISTVSVDSPKVIMKLTTVGTSDTYLKSRSYVIFCVGIILNLVRGVVFFTLFLFWFIGIYCASDFIWSKRDETVDFSWLELECIRETMCILLGFSFVLY